MNKKDLNALKRGFKKDHPKLNIRSLARGYARISGQDKKLISLDLVDFEQVSEEEAELYYLSAKKALSGKIGKNLFLLELEDSEKKRELEKLAQDLWNTESLEVFLKSYLEQLETEAGHLFINAFQCDYHFNKEERADFFLICFHRGKNIPLQLYFDRQEQSVRPFDNDQMLLDPKIDQAILYPLVDKYGADYGTLLYQAGTQKEPDEKIASFFGAVPMMTAKEQQEAFVQLLDEVCEGEIPFETLRQLRDQVEYISESADPDEEEPSLDSLDLSEILKASGIEEEKLKDFDDLYQNTIGQERLMVENILPAKKMNIRMEGITLNVQPEGMDRISVQKIEGKDYLVIDMKKDVQVDQIPVKEKSDE